MSSRVDRLDVRSTSSPPSSSYPPRSTLGGEKNGQQENKIE